MVIAKIKIAPGNVGWYDPLSGIHLTIRYPFADITSDMNTTNIKRSLKCKTILLVDGQLEVPTQVPTQVPVQEPVQELVQEPAQEPAQEPVQEPAQEPVQEKAEVSPAKNTKNSSTKKNTSSKKKK